MSADEDSKANGSISDARHLAETLRELADALDGASECAKKIYSDLSALEKIKHQKLKRLGDGSLVSDLRDVVVWLKRRYSFDDPKKVPASVSPVDLKGADTPAFDEQVIETQENQVGVVLNLSTEASSNLGEESSSEQQEDTISGETAESQEVISAELETGSPASTGRQEVAIPMSESNDESAIAEFIKEVVKKDEEESENDRNEAKVNRIAYRDAKEEAEKFYRELSEASAKISKRLDALPSLPEGIEANARPLIESRLESLSLISRMLKRLDSRVVPIEALDIRDLPPVGCTVESLNNLLMEGESFEQSQTRVREGIRKLSMSRYSLVTAPKEAARTVTKQLLDFVGRHILPILDSLDDGVSYTRPLSVPSVGRIASGFAVDLLEVYAVSKKELIDIIKTIGITVTPENLGEYIDYDSQEPFDSEPKPGAQDETVVSVSRNGYQRELPNQPPRVIRMAQVIIVKNPKGGA